MASPADAARTDRRENRELEFMKIPSENAAKSVDTLWSAILLFFPLNYKFSEPDHAQRRFAS